MTLNIVLASRDYDFWIARGRIDLVEIADDQKLIYFALKSVNCKFFSKNRFETLFFENLIRKESFKKKISFQNLLFEKKISK